MLQNLRSSTEPAHANAEASVSGHRLDSNGKSIQKVNKEEGTFSKSGEKWDLEYFCSVEVELRLRQNLELS